MRKELRIDRNSLVVQLVFSFMALILLTTIAVGLPAILLIRNQVERQTWARVNQGSHATEALYSAWQRRISDFALLTSQRPTLSQLLSQEKEKPRPPTSSSAAATQLSSPMCLFFGIPQSRKTPMLLESKDPTLSVPTSRRSWLYRQ